MKSTLAQRVLAEALGTAFLLAAVVGSGIMAAKLSGGNAALALLCNTLPADAILTVLILALDPVSGAHFNPAVTLAFLCRGDLTWRAASPYAVGLYITSAYWFTASTSFANRPLRSRGPSATHSPASLRPELQCSSWLRSSVRLSGLAAPTCSIVRSSLVSPDPGASNGPLFRCYDVLYRGCARRVTRWRQARNGPAIRSRTPAI